jgi:hypothetical protein
MFAALPLAWASLRVFWLPSLPVSTIEAKPSLVRWDIPIRTDLDVVKWRVNIYYCFFAI